jgi:galactose oxidase
MHAVLHTGPSTQMVWFKVDEVGKAFSAGTRPGEDAMCGTATMYHAGKILTAGGATNYVKAPGLATATVITIGPNFNVSVREVTPLTVGRSFANAAPLPDGTVLVIGGMKTPVLFNNVDAILEPGAQPL